MLFGGRPADLRLAYNHLTEKIEIATVRSRGRCCTHSPTGYIAAEVGPCSGCLNDAGGSSATDFVRTLVARFEREDSVMQPMADYRRSTSP